MRDNFRGSSLPEKIQQIATQKMKARILRNSMIFKDHTSKDKEVTEKIIKFSTFLSHKMIDKIKTQDLKMFQNQVKQLCKKPPQKEQSQNEHQKLSISRFLDDIKTSTKQNLLREKFRRKTEDHQNNCLSPKYHFSPNKLSERNTSPPQSKIKCLLELKRKRNLLDKRMKLKGVVMKSSLVDMMEKMESLNLPKVGDTQNIEENLLPTHKLKEEKERLATVLENGTIEFQPMGNVGKNNKNKRAYYSTEKKTVTQASSIVRKKSDTNHKCFQLHELSLDSKRIREELMIEPFGKGSKNSINTEQQKEKSMKEYVEEHIH